MQILQQQEISIHLQSTTNIVGDNVVGGLPVAPEPDNPTFRPCSGKIWGEEEILIPEDT